MAFYLPRRPPRPDAACLAPPYAAAIPMARPRPAATNGANPAMARAGCRRLGRENGMGHGQVQWITLRCATLATQR